jgi:hypothetical protein
VMLMLMPTWQASAGSEITQCTVTLRRWNRLGPTVTAMRPVPVPMERATPSVAIGLLTQYPTIYPAATIAGTIIAEPWQSLIIIDTKRCKLFANPRLIAAMGGVGCSSLCSPSAGRQVHHMMLFRRQCPARRMI